MNFRRIESFVFSILEFDNFWFIKFQKFRITYFRINTDSVRCVVGVRCQAITQVKQPFTGSVLGWVTAGPRPAHQKR